LLDVIKVKCFAIATKETESLLLRMPLLDVFVIRDSRLTFASDGLRFNTGGAGRFHKVLVEAGWMRKS